MTNTSVSFTIDINDRNELIKVSSILENMAHNLEPSKELTITLGGDVVANNAEDIINHMPMDHNSGMEDILVEKPSAPCATGQDVQSQTTSVASAPNVTEDAISGVDLDGNGLPWDSRIHSSSKKKTAKGVWKKRKNVPEATLMQVESELRQAMNAGEQVEPVVEATPPAPPAPPAPVEPTVTKYMLEGVAYTQDELVESGWTEDQIADLETVEESTPVATTATTFPEFLQKITQAVSAGELEQSDVDLAVQKFGFTTVALVAPRPDMIPVILNQLGLS